MHVLRHDVSSGTGDVTLEELRLLRLRRACRLGLTSGEHSEEEEVFGVSADGVLFPSGDTILDMLFEDERLRPCIPNSPGHSSKSRLFEFREFDFDLRRRPLRDDFAVGIDESLSP